jgi:nucleoid-associated protein EbfC
MANFAQMMQKAQAFKQKMQELQDKASDIIVEGSAGQGLVTCRMTGKHELKALKVAPSLIKAEEAEIMEDMIVTAVNDALTNALKRMEEESAKLMKDLGLPTNMGLPF